MPQCPICNAAIWVGQEYCSTCDNPLPRPEGEDYFCPQCGGRMDTPQEICQKCKATTPEIALPPTASPARAWKFPFRRLGIFLGVGLIIVALFLVFHFQKSTETPQPIMTPPSPATLEQTPTAPPVPALETAPKAPTVAVVQEVAGPSAPAAPVSPQVATPKPSLPKYWVSIVELSVREAPDMSAPRIAVLNLKEEVELLETYGGWGKVRNLERNIVGWSYMRYLQPVAEDGPRRTVSQHRPPAPKEPEPVSTEASKEL